MNRREVIAFLGGAAAAWPVGVGAQRTTGPRRVAYISTTTYVDLIPKQSFIATMLQRLQQFGWIEGQNLVMEWHSARDQPEQRLAEIVAEVVRSKPDLLLGLSTDTVQRFKDATTTIPIVMYVGDPVGKGLVASLSRPGGNITGISSDPGFDVHGKYIEILKEIKPAISKIGFLATRPDFDGASGRTLREAAGPFGVAIIGPPVDAPYRETDYRQIVAEMVRGGADALLVAEGPENFGHRSVIVGLAEENRLPALYIFSSYARSGGLVAYAIDNNEMSIRFATCIDLVLRGARPADIPIYQSTKQQLIVNLKTAKALGLTMPDTLLARADEVIE